MMMRIVLIEKRIPASIAAGGSEDESKLDNSLEGKRRIKKEKKKKNNKTNSIFPVFSISKSASSSSSSCSTSCRSTCIFSRKAVFSIIYISLTLTCIMNASIAAATTTTTTSSSSVTRYKNYTGHAILRIPVGDVHQILPSFREELSNGTDVHINDPEVLWTSIDNVTSEEEAFIRVPPNHLHRIIRRSAPSSSSSSSSSPANHRIVISNLQDWIDSLSLMSSSAEHHSDRGHFSSIVPNFRLDIYHDLDQIYAFIGKLSQRSTGVTVFDIGTTHEGRKLKGVEIVGNPNDPSLIWIDAGTHAREWITPAVAIFIMEQAILSRLPYNLVIVPVMNPDGYAYTWTHDRLWRKNRRPPSITTSNKMTMNRMMADESCYGVDLNRNYDVAFGGQGSSANACSHLYQGPEPLSEPETFSTANLIWTIRKQIKMFVSLHSFNQLWASPYAYSKKLTPHHAMHMDVLKEIQQAVYKSSGILYSIGPLSTSLYVGSGFALDWVYSHVNIPHSYLAELRDKGYYGFLLPIDQIIPTSQETWEGIKAGINKVYSESS